MGLGGAYTGIANDPSSTYYNPAGIVTGGRFQLMGSLSSIVFTRRTVENAFDSPNRRRGLHLDEHDHASLVHRHGREARDEAVWRPPSSPSRTARSRSRERAWAWACRQIDRPQQRRSAPEQQLQDEVVRDLVRGTGQEEHRSWVVGLSLAAKTANYSEDVGLASGGTFDEFGQRIGGDSVTASTGIGTTAYHIRLQAGRAPSYQPSLAAGVHVSTASHSRKPGWKRVSPHDDRSERGRFDLFLVRPG